MLPRLLLEVAAELKVDVVVMASEGQSEENCPRFSNCNEKKKRNKKKVFQFRYTFFL